MYKSRSLLKLEWSSVGVCRCGVALETKAEEVADIRTSSTVVKKIISIVVAVAVDK